MILWLTKEDEQKAEAYLKKHKIAVKASGNWGKVAWIFNPEIKE